MNTKYGLHNNMKAKPGKGDRLARILLKAAELVGAMEGCDLYMVSADTENEDMLWVTEVWHSKKDHDNSLQDKEVRHLITKAMPLLAEAPVAGREFNVLGGNGVSV